MARSRPARAGGIQMTEGPLYKNILLFSVPLIFSQLLQVLFNMADVAVVGKFSSATALGSVGSTSTLVTLFTGFLIGLSNGVNVRVAQYLGARQEEDTRNCVHTALILCTLSGVVIAVLCFFEGRSAARRGALFPHLRARYAGARHFQLRQRRPERQR